MMFHSVFILRESESISQEIAGSKNLVMTSWHFKKLLSSRLIYIPRAWIVGGRVVVPGKLNVIGSNTFLGEHL